MNGPMEIPVDDGSPRLRVMIGAPGSGKSTWCRTHPRLAGKVLSLDSARARLGAHEHDHTVNPAAVSEVATEVQFWLCIGQTVTLDATGATPDQRVGWLDLADLAGAVPIALIRRTPLDLCLARNAARARPVPPDAVVAIWHQVAQTTRDQLHTEGFTSVSEITEYPTPPC